MNTEMNEDEFRAAVAAAIARHDEILVQLLGAVEVFGDLCAAVQALLTENGVLCDKPPDDRVLPN